MWGFRTAPPERIIANGLPYWRLQPVKTSELISKLSEIVREHGDSHVYLCYSEDGITFFESEPNMVTYAYASLVMGLDYKENAAPNRVVIS